MFILALLAFSIFLWEGFAHYINLTPLSKLRSTPAYEVGTINNAILQVRKRRPRGVKLLAQVHTASKWWDPDLNPGSLVPLGVLLTIYFSASYYFYIELLANSPWHSTLGAYYYSVN